MTYILNFKPYFTGGIWLAVIFFVISSVLPLFIPKYNLVKFIKVPDNKKFNLIYTTLFYLQIIFLIFPSFSIHTYMFYGGLTLYFAGIVLYTASLFVFAISEYDKPVCNGPYKLSRHPVYFSFFIIIFGASLAVSNIILSILSVIFYFLGRRRAKREEAQCIDLYGDTYVNYLKKVPPFP